MWKDKLLSVYVFAAVLLIIFLPQLLGRWEQHPLTPAFAMMPEYSGKPHIDNVYIPDPTRPHAEVPSEAAMPKAERNQEEAVALLPSSQSGWPSPAGSSDSMHPTAAPADAADAVGSTVSSHPSPSTNADALAPDSPSASPGPDGMTPTPAPPSPTPKGTPKASPSDKKTHKRSIPVLNYHSIANVPGNVVVIHPDKFREQMKYLSENGYRPLTLTEFTDILEGKQDPPENPVLLTFDDGYTDNYTAAMPVLQEFGFPATLFMSPGMVGQSGYIDWEQAKALQENRWDIQPHGMTHPSLPALTSEQQTFEIMEARRLIEEKLGKPADIYCYPYGHYNRDTLDILSANGFRYAFTIDQGQASSDQHPYKLKRIFVNGEEELSSLVKKLAKFH